MSARVQFTRTRKGFLICGEEFKSIFGLRLIRLLLMSPGREIRAVTLRSMGAELRQDHCENEANDAFARALFEYGEEEDLGQPDLGFEHYTQADIDEIGKGLEGAETLARESRCPTESSVNAELASTLRQLLNRCATYQPRNGRWARKNYQASESDERERKAARKNINDALALLADIPATALLAEHLAGNIRTGHKCVYEGDWKFSF